MLRAFSGPLAAVRVLIAGQDPYPTPGHAVGLSFSVAPDVRPLPKSLVNIFKEYGDDLGFPPPANGDLSPWADAGVLLLNRVLSVAPGQPGAHRNKGGSRHRPGDPGARRPWRRRWSRSCGAVMRAGLQAAARRHALHRERAPEPPVGVERVLRVAAVQQGQRLLVAQGADPVDWRLP